MRSATISRLGLDSCAPKCSVTSTPHSCFSRSAEVRCPPNTNDALKLRRNRFKREKTPRVADENLAQGRFLHSRIDQHGSEHRDCLRDPRSAIFLEPATVREIRCNQNVVEVAGI